MGTWKPATSGSRTHPDAEARKGDAVLMVASNDADYQRPPLIGRSTGQGLYLLVDDVDSFHQKALAAGATSVIEPEETPWGHQALPSARSPRPGMECRHLPARN